MKKCVVALIAAFALGFFTADAGAGIVQLRVDPNTGELAFHFQAFDGEANEVFANAPPSPFWSVQDLDVNQTEAVSPCWTYRPMGILIAACPPEGVRRGTFELGDGADTFVSTGPILPLVVDGGEGADVIWGGRGEDVLTGGQGSDWIDGMDRGDRIEVRDGVADEVQCGTGIDTVIADVMDVVAADCELVERAPGPPPPPATTAATAAPAATTAPAAIHWSLSRAARRRAPPADCSDEGPPRRVLGRLGAQG